MSGMRGSDPSTATETRPDQRYIWRGPAMLVVDSTGAADGLAIGGFYYRLTRFLSRIGIELAGERPWLAAVAGPSHDVLEHVFSFPGRKRTTGGVTGWQLKGADQDEPEAVPRRALDLRLRYRVHATHLEATLTVANRSREPVEFDLAWVLETDYADFYEAWNATREQNAPVHASAEGTTVRFRYEHERLPFQTVVQLEGPGEWRWGGGRLRSTRALVPQGSETITVRIRPIDFQFGISDDEGKRREAVMERWRTSLARVGSMYGTGLLQEIVNANVEDMASFPLLEGEPDEWLAPAAGFPRFPGFFARDAFTAGWQAAMFDRGQMLDAALTRAGRLQGTRDDPFRDEQPGRIVQQARHGPMQRLELDPYGRYYGDQASPLMFVISVGQLYGWTGEQRSIRRHWDTVRGILDWAREHGDGDGDGYIEYDTRAKKGPKNQGWKDSDPAVVYGTGEIVPNPIAAAEIQGYWFAAQQIAAVLAWVLGEKHTARDYWRSATALRERFNRDFWWEAEGVPYFGLDPDKRPIDSVVSNAGHCLATGIVAAERVPRVVGRLFAPDMYSGYGIRTLSSAHPSFNPLSYHLGSVWAVENATIAFGLRRYGHDARALELARSLFDLARRYAGWRIPESVGGYGRWEVGEPGAFPRSDSPQLWNASVFPLLVQTILGARPVAALHLLAVDPVLPSWLPELVVRGVRVGGATATLRAWRDRHGRSQLEAVDVRGTLRLVRQPPLWSQTAGLLDRLGALVEGMLPSWSEPAASAAG